MTDWQKVREDYEAKLKTVKDICAAHGINSVALYKRAQDENWVLRNGMRPKRFKDHNQLENGSNRKALIDRLYKAFDCQMREFETHLALAGDEGVNEKDARTLGSLARTLEKLIDLRQENEGQNRNQNKEVDLERLREELARRLERVCPKGKTE
ncbi:MAG: hypothetical protein ABJN24_03705 [Hyphomicrobiales bacterium]